MTKPMVTLATLESRLHEVNSIRIGMKLYNAGKVKFWPQDDGGFLANVEDKSNARRVLLSFTRDGCDLDSHYCTCRVGRNGNCLCKHIVAAVLAIQGGVAPSGITLRKSASVHTVVDEGNTAKAVGSGSLDVFATPMMIAMMERAACECLADCLEPGQTSVGTRIDVAHTAATPPGAEITAVATIEYVFGRRIEFKVTARDGSGEIGNGQHTRVVVDAKRFVEKLGREAE